MRNSLILFALGCCTCAAAAEPCIVSWKNGHKIAVEKGIRFDVSLNKGKGECFQHGTAFLASASDNESISCDIILFSNAKINPGWNVRIVGDTSVFRVIPAQPNTFPILRVDAEAGKTVKFVPSGIEIGNEKGCDNWQNAFKVN